MKTFLLILSIYVAITILSILLLRLNNRYNTEHSLPINQREDKAHSYRLEWYLFSIIPIANILSLIFAIAGLLFKESRKTIFRKHLTWLFEPK